MTLYSVSKASEIPGPAKKFIDYRIQPNFYDSSIPLERILGPDQLRSEEFSRSGSRLFSSP